MDGGEAEQDRAPRRVAPGQVWIACALCRHPVELADSLETVEGHVCADCAPDSETQASRRPG
jgi:hypothetical protein